MEHVWTGEGAEEGEEGVMKIGESWDGDFDRMKLHERKVIDCLKTELGV